jgi:heme exporter protein D
MINLGPHAAFIVSAYAVAVAIVIGMTAWVWLDYRRQLRMLADLEARGITRRSNQVSEGKTSA